MLCGIKIKKNYHHGSDEYDEYFLRLLESMKVRIPVELGYTLTLFLSACCAVQGKALRWVQYRPGVLPIGCMRFIGFELILKPKGRTG